MKKFLMSMVAMLFAVPSLVFADAQVKPQGSATQPLLMIGVAVVFFYFILWRPERKRRKEMEAKRTSMAKGDKVTVMGIIGTIDRIEENIVVLKLLDGAKMEVLKAAISDVLKDSITTGPVVTESKK